MAASKKVVQATTTASPDMEGLELRLDTVIRLLALSVAPPTLTLKERAVTLRSAGMGPTAIAALCDTTRNTVSQALADARRKTTKQTKSKK